MHATSRYGLRSPDGTDSDNPPLHIGYLASDVEARLAALEDALKVSQALSGTLAVAGQVSSSTGVRAPNLYDAGGTFALGNGKLSIAQTGEPATPPNSCILFVAGTRLYVKHPDGSVGGPF